VLVLDSVFQEHGRLDRPIDLQHTDFIYHVVREKNGAIRYREWIVLNPDKIESFSADPRALPASVRADLQSALAHAPLPVEKRFYPAGELNEKNLHAIRRYLSEGMRGIPASLLRPLTSPRPGPCLEQALGARLAPPHSKNHSD
jgi:hypothetical protein